MVVARLLKKTHDSVDLIKCLNFFQENVDKL